MFLYMSPGHKEALAHLLYGLKEASGFVVITGEVGTGKTTILNAFLLKLPPRMPKVVVKNPHLQPDNLYFLLGEAIGVPEEKRSRNCIRDFEERLKEMGGAVLIIDEAQGLSLEMLEEVRLLSNLETVNEKLVQIMLLGQQELNEKLKSPDLRQLKQRIGIKYHIPPLDSNETKDYIDHRLRVAGFEPREKPLFTVSALTEIYRYTKGYPRLINIVCDSVLISAYTDNIRQINAPLVRKIVSELEGTYKTKKGAKSLTDPGSQGPLYARVKMAGAFAILVLAVIGSSWFFSARNQPVESSSPEKISLYEMHARSIAGQEANTAEVAAAGSTGGPQASAPLEPSQTKEAKAVAQRYMIEGDKPGSEPVIPQTIEQAPAPKLQGTVVTVNYGDTVAKLAAEHYGRVDDRILKAVKEANPGLPNMDLVYKGQKISLPQLGAGGQVLYSASVASYHSMDEAKAVFSDLSNKGYKATIYPYMDDQENTWYRITIGTFSSRQDAILYSKQLREKGFPFAKPVKISMEE